MIQDTPDETQVSCSRVLCMKSPFFYCYYNEIPCKVTIDSGAESNIVSLSFVQRSCIKMNKASQTARQLDKSMIKLLEVNKEKMCIYHIFNKFGSFHLFTGGVLS